MTLATLYDLYIDELRDLYNAANQLLQALPKLAQAASSPKLAYAFIDHLTKTKTQIDRLEMIFLQLDASPSGKICKAMEGLLRKAQDFIALDIDSSVLDSALIGTAQRIEHYAMAGYGCVRTYAHLLGEDQAADKLQQNLDEVVASDKELTRLAESIINSEALSPSGIN